MIIPTCRHWRTSDTAICTLLGILAIWLVIHTTQTLNYNWNWKLPLSYIATFSDSGIEAGLLWNGLLMSLRLMVLGGILSLLLGGFITALALSRLPPLVFVARIYVEGIRHLPPIVFMFIFFYFIISQIFNEDALRLIITYTDNTMGNIIFGEPARVENLIGGVLCLAIFEAAFVSEIMRAGILSINNGQWQAARSMGLSLVQTLRLIILPQAAAHVAAPLAGQFVLLVKDSAILSVISVQELAFSAQETAVSTQQIFETWLLVACLYFMLCAPLVWLCGKLAKKSQN